jgi:hypothetical protein
MPTGIIPVKLGRPLQMPKRKLVALLEQARRDCCKARNAAILHWYIWRRQHPHWEPGGEYEAPEPKIQRMSKLGKKAKQPKDSPVGPRLFLSREMYGVATAAAPNLSTSLASSCVQETIARLKANTPYDHDGEARWVWQAILAHEVSLPTWRSGRIPCPRACSQFVYDDHQCTFRFPLLSKASGYRTLSPVVRLEAGDKSVGDRRLLRKLADGTWRLADSQLTERKGKWFVDFCYKKPVAAVDLDTEKVMTLLPAQPDDRWPFLMEWNGNGEGDDDARKRWKIGKAHPLVAEYRRVVARRRAIRYRSRDGCGKGHGRKGFYKILTPINRAVIDMQSRFRKLTVADIIAFTIREGCGALLYREPTKPVRECCWFERYDVPFAWVEFEAFLKFKAEAAGLKYENRPRIGMAEWRPQENQKDVT